MNSTRISSSPVLPARASSRAVARDRARLARFRAVVFACGLAFSAWIEGCDNPSCVFSGNCGSSGGGGLGANAASTPVDHEWLLAGAPAIERFFPGAGQIGRNTPIVIEFSESMAFDTLQDGIVVIQETGLGLPLPMRPTLLGDGRVLVLVPVAPFPLGGVLQVKYDDNAVVTDLQGTAIVQPASKLIGTIVIAAADPVVPSVVATWPQDLSTNQSATGEIVVVFDRKMNVGTVTGDSFTVTVNGAPPVHDALAQPVVFTDSRVFAFRSLDTEGEIASLGTSGHVAVSLSPTGDKILADGGGVLPATIFEYDIAAFAAPLAAEVVSVPMDAIGIANLDGTRPLDIAVELEDGQPNDRIGMFVFGTGKTVDKKRIALFRDVRLGDIPFDSVTGVATIGEGQIDLAESGSPVVGHLADGEIVIALRVQRGNAFSPVRLLDVDDRVNGPQSPLFDVTRPTLTGFGTSGTDLASFVSDTRDMTIVGRANERVRSVEVTSTLGNNGTLPSVVGSQDSGLFIAAPVALGVLDPAQMPLSFTATIFDEALNPAIASTTASFRQVGASGPGAALPGNATVDVEVFDARTLAAIGSALVFTHQDLSGTVTPVDADATLANGKVTLNAAPAGETIVTVDAANYDLFTYHGVPTARIAIPLRRTQLATSFVQGVVSTDELALPGFERFTADARRLPEDPPQITVQACSPNPSTLRFECGFGPERIAPGPLGAVGFVGIDTPSTAFSYVAQTFLRAYELELPIAPAAPGQTSAVSIAADTLLDSPDTDDEERTLDGPAAVLNAVGITGLDLANLNGVSVEVQGQSPGLAANALAGAGVAFDLAGAPVDRWAVRCAIPGRADPTDGKYSGDEKGELVLDGTFRPDLFLRCEVRDDSDNRTGRRPRFPSPGVPANLVVPDVPLVQSPAAGGHTGAASFDLVFDDVLDGAIGQPGIYRATLTSASGRRWTLVRADGGAASRTIHVPDIGSAGGSPLSNGSLECTVEAFAWPGFDEALFLWTDLEREYDAFAASAPISFDQP